MTIHEAEQKVKDTLGSMTVAEYTAVVDLVGTLSRLEKEGRLRQTLDDAVRTVQSVTERTTA